jgi:hypothetical protein
MDLASTGGAMLRWCDAGMLERCGGDGARHGREVSVEPWTSWAVMRRSDEPKLGGEAVAGRIEPFPPMPGDIARKEKRKEPQPRERLGLSWPHGTNLTISSLKAHPL